MALPPKKNIDFDVYERQDPTSTVDWAGAAADITKTFATIRDTRQARKDDLEKNIEEQRIALNDIGEYDSLTLRQVALESSQQSADELAMKADQMRRGLLRPNDLMKFKSNQSSGWTQFKNNAESWDKKFQEFSTRTTDGLNSSAERELAEMVSTFGNLKNMKFLTDDDGNMSYARLDDNGEIIPGESMSANAMTNLLNQKINSYNATDAAKAIGDKIGVVITSVINPDGIRTNISTEERARAESDFFNDAENAELIDQYANEMTTNPRDLAVMMVDSDLTGLNGVKYENNFVGGPENGEDKHAKWADENDGKDQSLNPYIKWEWNGNSYEPSVSEEQKKAGNDYAKDLIKGTFNIKQTDRSQKIEKNVQPQPNAATINEKNANKKLLSQGKNLMMAVSGDPDAAKAGIGYLVDASNGQISGIEKTADGFIVSYPPDANGTPVDPFFKSTKDMDSKESMRAMWKAAGLQDTEFDAWLDAGGDELLEGTETTRDLQNIKGAQKGIKYDPQATVLLDGVEVTAVDFIVDGPLGKSPSSLEFNTNAQFINEYSNLLNQESFFPKGIGAGKITMDGDTMTFTIGDKAYDIGDVFGQTTTETIAILREKIEEAISTRKAGGAASGF